jgi:hypothetical protein
MSRKRRTSPILNLTIGQEQIDRAVQSNSGACLIADAIKAQYPELSGITVDMATIRVSDRKRGERYTYLTSPAAQHVLLAFDQGWPNPADHLTVERAVQINPIRCGGRNTPKQRAARRAELQEREAAGTITRNERGALTRLHREPDRPTANGPAKIAMERGQVQVRGGAPRLMGAAHPNLLRSRNRHFGAKLADPGVAFREAVETAVAERLAAEPAPGSS